MITSSGIGTGGGSATPADFAGREHMERARVACVYKRNRPDFALRDMSEIRFVRMAEALARRGHEVDLVLDRAPAPRALARNLREVPYRSVRWADYDVIKTFFHAGFSSLVAEGGADHPFI